MKKIIPALVTIFLVACGDAVIDLGNGNSITLHGIQKNQLITRNFIIF